MIGGIIKDTSLVSWPLDAGMFFRPLFMLSLVLDHSLFGIEATFYHAMNIILHTITACGVYFLVLRLMDASLGKTSRNTPLAAALLFATLANHSESVAWISGRADILAACFSIFATIFFLSNRPSNGLLHPVFTLTLLAAGFLSKESALVTPFIWCLFLVFGTHAKGTVATRGQRYLCIMSLVLLVLYFLLRRIFLETYIGGYGASVHVPMPHTGLWKSLLHFSVRSLTPPLPLFINDMRLALIAVLSTSAILLMALRTHSRLAMHRIVWILLACFIVALLPVLGMDVRIHSTEGERFVYYPSVLGITASTFVLFQIIRSHKIAWTIVCVVILANLYYSNESNMRWVAASHLCERIAKEVAAFNPDQTFIMSIPDNYQGAYVFRNGLSESVAMYRGDPSTRKYEWGVSHDVVSCTDTFSVTAGAIHSSTCGQSDVKIVVDRRPALPQDVYDRPYQLAFRNCATTPHMNVVRLGTAEHITTLNIRSQRTH